jgi:regulatory protein
MERMMTEEQALSRLAAECSRSEHCSGEMAEKLRRWGFDEIVQARVIAYLVEHRYVDDHRYAELFVREKMKFNHWGPRKIEQALWAKHVDEAIYRPVLDAVSREEWAEILRPLLKSKQKSIKAETPYEEKMKLMRFAMGRGFTMEEIDSTIHNL